MEATNEKTGEGRVLSLTTLEKGVIALFASITFAMMSWITVTTNSTATDLEVMKTSISFIQRDAEAAGVDRFTGNQGRDLTRRVEEVEKDIKDLREEINKR